MKHTNQDNALSSIARCLPGKVAHVQATTVFQLVNVRTTLGLEPAHGLRITTDSNPVKVFFTNDSTLAAMPANYFDFTEAFMETIPWTFNYIALQTASSTTEVLVMGAEG